MELNDKAIFLLNNVREMDKHLKSLTLEEVKHYATKYYYEDGKNYQILFEKYIYELAKRMPIDDYKQFVNNL